MEPTAEELTICLESSDPVAREAALNSLISGLKQDPDRWAEAAGSVIDSWLDAGGRRDELDTLLDVLHMATEGSGTFIPPQPLRRIIAQGMEAVGNHGVVMAAHLLLQQDPKQGILTQGVDHVLIASELSLIQAEQMQDSEDGSVSRWLRQMVKDLWSTVVRHDPPTIIALLEVWLAQAGWQSRLGAILIEHAVTAAKSSPGLLEDTLRLFEPYENTDDHETENAESWVDPATHYIAILHELKRDWMIQQLAVEIARGLDPADFRGASIEPCEPAAFEPDPHADKILIALLEDDERVQWPARDELADLFEHPTSGLILPACEVVDAIRERDASDPRIGQLIHLMCIHLATRADLVPVDALMRWAAKDSGLPDFSRMQCFSLLASARPDRIVDGYLEDAISLHTRHDLWSFWKNMAAAYPGLIGQFADAWFDRVGTGVLHVGDLGSQLLGAISYVAEVRPEAVKWLIAVLERHQRADAAANEGAARADEFASTLETLRRDGGGS